MRDFLFVLGSARENGNSEQLARLAASQLPAHFRQTWEALRDAPLPTLQDLRHGPEAYVWPAGNEERLLLSTLSATDIVFVTPVYWYSVPTSLKNYIDHWTAWMRLSNIRFRDEMRQKRFWVIASHSRPLDEIEPMLRMLQLTTDYFGAGIVGYLLGSGSKPGDALQERDVLSAAKVLFREGTGNA